MRTHYSNRITRQGTRGSHWDPERVTMAVAEASAARPAGALLMYGAARKPVNRNTFPVQGPSSAKAQSTAE